MTVTDNVNSLFKKHFDKLPNLNNPKTMSEKIQWLKVYNQDIQQVICCDKYAAKIWAEERIGKEYIIPNASQGCFPVVIKANNNSGGVGIVTNKNAEQSLITKTNKIIKKTYGVKKGEWAYSYIKPRLIREHKIETNNIDYKFHCANGEVRFLQVIYDMLSTDASEVVYDSHGKKTNLHVNYKNMLGNRELPISSCELSRLMQIAKDLSKGHKYVRIDLYYTQSKEIYFGEATFWPLSGCIKTSSDLALGNILDFDTTTKHELTFDNKFHAELDKLYQKYS